MGRREERSGEVEKLTDVRFAYYPGVCPIVFL